MLSTSVWRMQMFSSHICHAGFAAVKASLTSFTCVEPLLEFLNLVGGARFSVYSFSVEAMHFNVVDKLLHDQRHCPLIVSQARDLNSKLPGGELWIKLFKDTRIMHPDVLRIWTQLL